MGGIEIKDGVGTGNRTQVDADNRLHTKAHTVLPVTDKAASGDAYWVASDFITLTTTASFTGCLYMKNISTTKHYHMSIMRQSSSTACQWRAIKNPTTGTLISAGTAITPENGDFSAGKTAEVTTLKGVDAQTITDGFLIGQLQTPASGVEALDIQGGMLLRPGDSIAIEAKPGTNPTTVGMTWTFWEEIS